MKNRYLLILLLLISCGQNTKESSTPTVKAQDTIHVEGNSPQKDDTANLEMQPGEKTKVVTSTKITSKLRPNKPIPLNQIYRDTINFIRFNDDSDYWYFLAQKNKDTIQIIYDGDMLIHELAKAKGDEIVINWKMTRLQEAGDDEITYVKPYLISFEKVSSNQSANKSVNFLWRENKYDEEQKGIVSTILINESYCNTMSNQEKAALAYSSFDIGNECWWDNDKANEDRSNLKCKILTALDLGYQCSDKQLGFLRNSFAKDTIALKKIKRCRTMPYTATIQTTFDEILIDTDKMAKTISVSYKAHGINSREATKWSWTQTDNFKYDSENVTLINSEKSERIDEGIQIEEN